jgi:hypothetical protein
MALRPKTGSMSEGTAAAPERGVMCFVRGTDPQSRQLREDRGWSAEARRQEIDEAAKLRRRPAIGSEQDGIGRVGAS